ncbi:hypothetical protein GCM10027416_23480 [Okibacterium endophyticum]
MLLLRVLWAAFAGKAVPAERDPGVDVQAGEEGVVVADDESAPIGVQRGDEFIDAVKVGLRLFSKSVRA